MIRSLKRYLEDAGPETILEAGGASVPLAELMHGLLHALHRELAANFGDAEKVRSHAGRSRQRQQQPAIPHRRCIPARGLFRARLAE